VFRTIALAPNYDQIKYRGLGLGVRVWVSVMVSDVIWSYIWCWCGHCGWCSLLWHSTYLIRLQHPVLICYTVCKLLLVSTKDVRKCAILHV